MTSTTKNPFIRQGTKKRGRPPLSPAEREARERARRVRYNAARRAAHDAPPNAAPSNVAASSDATANTAPQDAPNTTPTPPDPFGGAVAADLPPDTARERTPPPASAPKITIDPAAAAPLILAAHDALIVPLASMRYGEHGKLLTISDPESRALIEPALVEWLKTQAIDLTPGQALALAYLMVTATKLGALEVMRAQERRERAANAPKAPSATP